jgi:hypothetical protein
MKARALLAVMVLALAFAPAASAAGRSDASLAQRPDPSTCDVLEVPTAAPFGAGACTGVRPGAMTETPLGFCSLNFAFRGRRGARYIGTAGHCIVPEESGGGERTWKRGKGPKALDLDGRTIGRFAYGVLELDGERDFALIRLRKGLKPNPSICHFGGPTGINRDVNARTQTLNAYGNGLATGDLVPARQLVVLGLPNPDHVFATGVVAPGDSGGPVTSADGRAVGVIVSGGVLIGGVGTGGVDAGTVGVTRVGPQVDRAESKLRERLRLLTAARR